MVVNRDSSIKIYLKSTRCRTFPARRLIYEVRSLHARFDNEYTQGWLNDTQALF